VMVDPHTAAAAGPGGRLPLTIDGLAVLARVAGVLRRFPTVPTGAGGFIVADQATLSAALDAQLPGQGRPDELWISTARHSRLRATLQGGPLAQLDTSFRADIERRLRGAPIARAVLGVLIAAALVSVVLAVCGLIVAIAGTGRDPRIDRDLIVQGVGPRALRGELRVRMMLASIIGVCAGLPIATALTRLAVGSVQGAGLVSAPVPPLVTVEPVVELLVGAIAVIAILAIATAISAATVSGRERWS